MAKFNFKIDNVTNWTINNCNIQIAQYLRVNAIRMKFGKLIKYNIRNIFLQKSCRK